MSEIKNTIVKTTAADQNQILSLLNSAKGEGLSTAERAKSGFVQGRMDADLVTKFQADLGVYAVKDNENLIAVAFASRVGITDKGPIVLASEQVLQKMDTLKASDIFQYGPVVVASQYKGKGLLTALLLHLCSLFQNDFKKGLAFVEEANALSMNIHTHYFGEPFDTFRFQDRKYYTFLFDPKVLLEKYNAV